MQEALGVDLDAEFETDAGLLQQDAAPVQRALVEAEGRQAARQHAADLRVAVIYGYVPAGAIHRLGEGQPRRAGADHRGILVQAFGGCQHRAPAARQRLLGHRVFDGADGDGRFALPHSGAGAFTESVLRAQRAAEFRQRGGSGHDLGGGLDFSLGGLHQPFRNPVVQRAGRAAGGLAAVEAARGLGLDLGQRQALGTGVDTGQFGGGDAAQEMGCILAQGGAQEVAHVADLQRIGRAGHHAAGAAHAIFQPGDAAIGLALLPHRDAHVAGLLAAAAVDAALFVHPDVVEAGVVQEAEGGAEGAEEAAVGAVTDQGGDEEGTEIGGGNQQVEAADEGQRP